MKDRLQSLDALRGLDMFMMMGVPMLAAALAKIWPVLQPLKDVAPHCDWEGFHIHDLVFPMFVFISGISAAFSVAKSQANGVSAGRFARRLLERFALLAFFGACMGGLLKFDLANTRFFSVLALIGFSSCAASVVAWNTKTIRALLFWALGVFLMVAVIQFFVKIDGLGGTFEKGKMINGWFDQFVPGRCRDGAWDPIGVLCMVSAVVIPLIGCAAGRMLMRRSAPEFHKSNLLIMFGCGIALVVAGCALSPVYPVIKKAWTGTFNLVSTGIAMMMFAAFYGIIDVWGKRAWSVPLQDVGKNAIACYLAINMFDIPNTVSRRLFKGLADKCGNWDELVMCLALFVVVWFIFRFCRQRNIFFKV